MAKLNLLLLAVLVACTAALVTSCSSTSGMPAIEVPREVLVRVPVPCVDAVARPQRPATRTASDLLAMDRYRRTLASWSDLAALRGYAAELEAVVEGCSRLPAR